METGYYILGVLLIGLLSLLMIRYWTRKSDLEAERIRSASSRRRRAKPVAGETEDALRVDKRAKAILQREIRQVPTPWGWPRHVERNRFGARPVLSDQMQSFTNRLIKEKELARKPAMDPRISSSIRALLEDRYGPVDRRSAESIEYQKVKAPLLRDPNRPVDQLDHFGSRDVKPDRNKLQNLAAMKTDPGKIIGKSRRFPRIDLKDVKLPWGW